MDAPPVEDKKIVATQPEQQEQATWTFAVNPYDGVS